MPLLRNLQNDQVFKGKGASSSSTDYNGIRLEASNDEVAHAGLSVADGTMNYEDVLAWVKKHRI